MNDESVYVVWSSDDEIIICTLADEHKLIRDFFEEGGRNKEDYDRSTTREIPFINARLSLC